VARTKYYYNSETCKYEQVKTKPGNVVVVAALFLLGVALFSIGLIWAGYKVDIFETHEMSQLRSANKHLKNHNTFFGKQLKILESNVDKIAERDEELYRSIFDEFVDTLGSSVRLAGIGGLKDYNSMIAAGKTNELIAYNIGKINELNARIKLQVNSHKELEKAARKYDLMLSSKPAIQPISNKELTRLASGFGWRIHPILKVKKFHYGIDFSAKRGTPIYATGDGKVSKVKTSLGGYGMEVEVDHGFGYVTKYAHLQKFNVKLGKKVKRGDIIGSSINWTIPNRVKYFM